MMSPQPGRDLVHRLADRHGRIRAVRLALHAVEQAVGVVVLLGQGAALHAREAVVHRVLDVADDLDDPAILDVDPDAAERVAEAAEAELGLAHGQNPRV